MDGVPVVVATDGELIEFAGCIHLIDGLCVLVRIKKGNGGKCLLNGLHKLAVLVELVALLLQSLSRGHAAHGLFLLLLSLGDQS